MTAGKRRDARRGHPLNDTCTAGELKRSLPAETYASAVERGKALNVVQTAQEALAWLEQMEE